MDGTRFDRMVKLMAHGSSRRNAIRALGTAAAGLAVTRPGADAEEVTPEVNLGGPCQRDRDCSNDGKCRKGRCTCAEGHRRCKGRCLDLGSNNQHCGRCGRGCGKNETCIQGRCRPGMA
ncbi:MAG: EB domain-containing protein [Chloroflexota bacterium]